MTSKVSILLPCYKSSEVLKNVFIPSYVKNCKGAELVVYDNGGNNLDDLFSNLTESAKSDIIVLGDGRNVGLNAALNVCAKHATGDWFYLPHTDMHILPGALDALLSAVKGQVPWNLLLCSRSIEKHSHIKEQLIMDFGTDLDSYNEDRLYKFFEGYKDKDSIITGKRMPFFMHRKLWEKMGGVDEYYFSFATDDDLIQEAYDVGVRKFWMVFGSCVYHLSGHSNKQQTVDRDDLGPYQYFVDKWRRRGYNDAHHPGQWHDKLIPNGVRIK